MQIDHVVCSKYGHSAWREPANTYYINTGYALAPATSANDSEQQSMSSDADTLSLTDSSSVDGIPPYRYRKRHRREVHDSAKANGRVSLPHIPRTLRMPKNIEVEPERFAAELIRRLESILREREAQEKLEERLQMVRLEEEGEDADVSTAPSLASHRFFPMPRPPHQGGRHSDLNSNVALAQDAHEENPESILDEHVQRVMKTPDCQLPESRSPDGLVCCGAPEPPAAHPAKTGPRTEAGGAWHHQHGQASQDHTLHAGGLKDPREPAGPETLFRPHRSQVWPGEPHPYGGKSCSYADGTGVALGPMEALGYSGKGHTWDLSVPTEELERNQKIVQWMMAGEKEAGRHKRAPYGGPLSHEVSWSSSGERPGSVHPWTSAQLRHTVQPAHPFIQDPTMPPNPAPNPLTQLEEARRRLEDERKRGTLQTKHRYVMEVIQRGRSAVRPAALPPLSLVPAVSDTDLSECEYKSVKRPPCENMVVAYYFCGEPIPYRTSVRGSVITLSQFKELLTKRGSYRYYFKKVSDEFDCGVVFEEVREDSAILPIFEEKIIGKVEKVD
ncbi:hypothetical protein SKAU_G00047230 [Synaphobranchus kaupii]|uniref:Axin-1 n=1 Tax=Synaphobranchus kaupii TaxID=118154 RepID=A0A9Q1G348_SYNKA|nr:hypothetical protein SKAU_G00047230 [Synaphobranchus kaupii]